MRIVHLLLTVLDELVGMQLQLIIHHSFAYLGPKIISHTILSFIPRAHSPNFLLSSSGGPRLRYQLFSSAGHTCPIGRQHINIVRLSSGCCPVLNVPLFCLYFNHAAVVVHFYLPITTQASSSSVVNHQLPPPPMPMLVWGIYLAASVAQGRSPSIIKSPR